MPRKSKTTTKDPFHKREKAKYDKPIASREHLLELLKSKKVPLPQEHISEKMG